MKTRNPIARNAWKVNKAKVIPNKRKDYQFKEDRADVRYSDD